MGEWVRGVRYDPKPDKYGVDDEYLDSGTGLAMLHSPKARHRGEESASTTMH